MNNTPYSRRAFLKTAGLGLGSLALFACGNARNASSASSSSAAETGAATPAAETPATETPTAAVAQADPTKLGNAAIVYFSWSGNTRSMAERISSLSGARVWEIVPVEPYPTDYNECTEVALAEQQADTLRAYQGDIDDWDSVNTVFLGYPIWWMALPQIVKKFVADHNWQGKTLVPFCTSYNSKWSGTREVLAESCAGATMLEGIHIPQVQFPDGVSQIDAWYAGLGLS